MKQTFQKIYGPFLGGRAAIGLLLLRLVIGGAFMQHGYGKITHAFHWGDKMGIPPIFQALAALAEFGGGLALIVGLLTPLAAFGIACTMIVALKMAHLPAGHPWVAQGPGPSFEDVAFYLVAAIMFIFTGPGKLSLDSALLDNKKSN